ncbi:transposase [Reticulibacter mediterranei]|uniref:Transposase n=1 Tax=Reticulibacter mediterranei TaxID=2778369 RepID=A0A8J3MX87_9CHLR|nr:RNA-guided endonuclease TnpB family protein [Reticulibacter mediterranei]GHO90684.1 transposase [Reticulibacter mediterranei]
MSLIYEYKLDGTNAQYSAIEEAIRTTQFVRNKCLRLWMDTRGTNRNDLQCYCAQLAKEYDWACALNSQARQAAADRAWAAISRFYVNCRNKKPGKKGYPQFQHDCRSVEYKRTGWRLEPDGRHITFTDGCQIGQLRLVGTRDIETFPITRLKRVRLIRRADGFFCQFLVQAQRRVHHVPTGKETGIDLGLKEFLTDAQGNTVANPRHLRKAEKKLKRLHRRLSRTQKRSSGRKKARKKLAKGYLKVSRQREDFARKTANALVSSHDFIAFEKLSIANLVKNRKLAKSISDASWGRFLLWLRYYGAIHDIPVIGVEPAYTTADCSACGARVKKSLSIRTHICRSCGLVLDRDHNAAINILAKSRTVGQTETAPSAGGDNASGQPPSTSSRRKPTTGKVAE